MWYLHSCDIQYSKLIKSVIKNTSNKLYRYDSNFRISELNYKLDSKLIQKHQTQFTICHWTKRPRNHITARGTIGSNLGSLVSQTRFRADCWHRNVLSA